MCIHELGIALLAQKRILPIYYRDCKNGLRSTFNEEESEESTLLNQTSQKIEDIQYMDFRKLRNKNLDSEVIQDFLDQLTSKIA
jgi:hypothetical protein